MQIHSEANLKQRCMAVLLAFMMIAGLSGGFNPMLMGRAMAAGHQITTDDQAATGRGDSIFDVVGPDGRWTNEGGFKIGESGEQSISTIIDKYKSIATALTGVLTITMFIFMLIQFSKLSAAGDNEMARKKATMGILTTGISVALLGSATIVVGFFWNALGG